MKHLLNDMSFEERQNIREQHTGGMKVMSDSFRRLVNGKLGDSKPLVSEQVTTDTTTVPVTTDTTTVVGGGGAAVESVSTIVSRFPNIKISGTPKKHTNGITVMWDEKPPSGTGGVVKYFKDCNTGALTKYNGQVSVDERNARSILTLSLCRSLIPDSQVVKNSDEYSAKQAEYIKNNPLQTGPPTHYRSDG